MFGQQNKSAFGGSSFGGGSTFGNTTPFGSGNASFGAKTGTSSGGFGGFGAQTVASGGLFGNTSTTSTTGGGSLFSANPGTTGFGGTNQNTTGFNFGGQQQQQSTTGGLFGGNQQAANTSSLFGTPTSNSAFGAKTPASGFGATSQSGGGLFGNTNTGGTSLFGGGATASNTGTGLFGGGAPAFGGQAGQAGTVIKFNAPTGQDSMLKNGVTTSISTRHQCITAMKEYENKSLEELRMEDYTANRKGPQQAGGLFGGTQTSQASTGFTFNQQQKQTSFGGSLGGTSTSGGLFGQTQTQGTSLFGGGANKTLFGGATTTTTASTGFGGGFGTQSATGTSLFGGNQQQNKPGGLFGTTPAPSQSGGLFGSTAASSSGGFGGFNTGGGFGTTSQAGGGGLFGGNKPSFGATTSAPSLFGTQSQAGGIFNKPATSTSFGFGAGTTANAGFGTQNQGGLFGNKPAFGTGTNPLGGTTGGFGTNLGTGLGTGSSLFAGTSKPNLGGGLGTGFGTSTSKSLSTSTTTSTNTVASTTFLPRLSGKQIVKPDFGGFGGTGTGSIGLGSVNTGTLGGSADAAQQIQQAQMQQQLIALANSPYGDSPLFRDVKLDGKKKEDILKPTNPAAQKAALSGTSQYKVSPRPTAKIKPKPIQSLVNGKSQLFDGLDDEDSSFGNDTFIPRKSVKKLVIRNSNRSLDQSSTSLNRSQMDDSLVSPVDVLPNVISNGTDRNGNQDDNVDSGEADVIRGSKDIGNGPVTETPAPIRNQLDNTMAMLNAKNRVISGRDGFEEVSILQPPEEQETRPPHPAGILLTRPGYYTDPALDELAQMTDDNGHCEVENFSVGREGYGNVFFEGITDVTGLNLDDIVHFRRKEITVYPDDDVKPPVGEGLNKKAQVTLDCVWPNDRSTRQPIKDPERLQLMNYQEKIEQATAKIGAKFVDYRPETGSWVFEVKHFSKYGLVDDSDEEGEVETDPKKMKLLQEEQQKQLAIQKQKIHLEKLKAGEIDKQQLTDKELLQMEEAAALHEEQGVEPEQQQGLLAKSLQEEGEEELYKIKQISAQGAPQPMADDDSDMVDIMGEKFPEDDRYPMEDMEEDGHIPVTHRLASHLGVDAQQVQVMKASFFADEEEDEAGKPATMPPSKRGLGGSLFTSSVMPTSRFDKDVTVDDIMEDRDDVRKREAIKRTEPSMFASSFVRPGVTQIAKPMSPMRRTVFQDRKAPSPGIIHPVARPFVPPPAPEHKLMPSGMPQEPRIRKVVGSRIMRAIPTFEDSVLYNEQHMSTDAGLFHGRAFRIGWGPGHNLVHCGAALHAQQSSEQEDKPRGFLIPSHRHQRRKRLDATPYQVTMEKIHICTGTPTVDPVITNMIEDYMEIQLAHSECSTETACPLYVPQLGVEELHKCAEQAAKHSEQIGSHPDADTVHHTNLVMQLCVALWGTLLEYQHETDVDKTSYRYHKARREAFSRWLSSAASRKIKKEVQDNKFKGENHIIAVMSLLSGNQISQACRLAQEAHDHRLALLVAQAAGADFPRKLLAEQLLNWNEQEADQFIEEERLKIYSVLAGMMVWEASRTRVNTCEELDWKRCLAIHLWFCCTPSATISDALKVYDVAFQGHDTWGKYAAAPLPPYLEDSIDYEINMKKQGSAKDKHVVYDTCYHLLKLYSDRSHPLERLLAPTTSTPDHLDMRLSWCLWRILQALEYRQMSEYHAACMCSSFASQLETLGMWHWAAFVLLHIPDYSRREAAVKKLLGHHVRLSHDEQYLTRELFVLEKLQVPTQWIHEAKATRAKYEGRSHDEAWHLLKAGRWNESHQILLRHVAPDAIINEDYDYVKKYLREMAPLENSSSIQNWSTGGKVFLDYITMVETIDEIKQGAVGVYELEKLQPEVTSLCSRISQLDCHDAKDRLCQAEMAKKTATLMRTLLMLQTSETHPEHQRHVPTRLLAPHLSKLPMPEDYALMELKDLTRSYMLEVTQ